MILSEVLLVEEEIEENMPEEVFLCFFNFPIKLCMNVSGANVNNKFLTGGVCDLIGNLIGEAAHRFLGL